MIEQLLEEIEDLKKAKELLGKVWNDVGPYNDRKIDQKTIYEMQDYFKFDDSE